MPDFQPFPGTRSPYCSLLDINPAYDLDSNPADGVVDASTATLVGRVPRAIPGRPGYYVCAIAPAGGFVTVKKSAGLLLPDPIRYAYTADQPNTYMACGAGGYLYKLGAINSPGDATSDFCMQCPRGSYASSAASLCIACPVNNFQDRPGQRACKPCQYGYAPFAGAARCMGCYYGRPYCSEGHTPNDALFTCNPQRLPEGYSPEGGFSVVRPSDAPTSPAAAAKYAPMFKNCNVGGGSSSLLAFNVSAECKVDMYVLGDLGRGGQGCSQNADTNSITAYYTAPNMLAGVTSPGLGGFTVGIAGVLDGEGLATKVFATSRGARIPDDAAATTQMKLVVRFGSGWGALWGLGWRQGRHQDRGGFQLDVQQRGSQLRVAAGARVALRPRLPPPPPHPPFSPPSPPAQLPESGWSYLGGGDNGQGQNANLKGVNFDSCPAGAWGRRQLWPWRRRGLEAAAGGGGGNG
jgi:hypothetical protein